MSLYYLKLSDSPTGRKIPKILGTKRRHYRLARYTPNFLGKIARAGIILGRDLRQHRALQTPHDETLLNIIYSF